MAQRGGPVTHAIARAGWAVFGMLGALPMVVVAVLYMSDPSADAADNSAVANLVGGLVVFVPIGAAVGGLLGLLAQFAARSWLRAPTPAERRAAREVTGLRPSGRWMRSYKTCAEAVTSFHAIVATLPAGAGRDWLTDIGTTLDDELSEALRLAKLGESLHPEGRRRMSETASKVADLLSDAERSFAETTQRAAAIALDLRDESDFVRVRAQLDMLAEQTPHLRAEGID